MTSPRHRLRLVRLSVEAMEALVAKDLPTASAEVGVSLTPYLVEESWLWRIRLAQVAHDPQALDWIARAALDVDLDTVVGHVGFHGPPDERGMVEVAYSVDPAVRRRGYASSMLEAALNWVAAVPEVSVVRASIAPSNEASLATVRPFGFEPVGEQWDEEDGLELLFERAAR